MKKIYDRQIIQYDIQGNHILTFENRDKASKLTNIHKDSIISCCKGKYKTAGGFIFRFEGDLFNLNQVKENKNIIECGICHSNETIRSMAMHLKFAHNLKTDEYVKTYKEFRPKQIENSKREKESGLTCQECNKKVKSNQQLMYHLTKDHPEISQYNYIIKYKYNNINPLCKCGCGEEVTILRNGKNCDLEKDTYNRDYIKGHWDWEVFKNINNQSKEEIEILDYIKSIYKGVIKTGVREFIERFELDILIPELKIAIEYNGLYWHSERNDKGKEYHITKTKLCKEKGIRLIQIFSDEWYNKKEIVKSKLNHIINKTSKSIYARKCTIKSVDKKIKNAFLNKTHIQGEDRSKIHLGLYNNEELVGVMTFSNSRVALGGKDTNKNIWELSRFATSTYVVGGASKLIKHFQKNYNPEMIYSYSDNRWTNPENNVYLQIGFNKIKSSEPGYWYTKDFKTRIHRYNFRKQKLKQMGVDIEGKTEDQITKSLGYYKVWDCGVTRYELI
jgi:hypothetical protein